MDLARRLYLAEYAFRALQRIFNGSDHHRALYRELRAELQLLELLAARALGAEYFIPLR